MSRSQPPNVLLVIAEHHSGDEIGALGSPVVTPALDRLVTEGVTFTEARTPTALCGPARASLMSGRYAHTHGMWNNPHTPAAVRRDLVPGVTLWSESLRDQGYAMSYLGKWHVSADRSPADVGWEIVDADIPVEQGLAHLATSCLRPAREGWPSREPLYGTTALPEDQLGDSRRTQRAVEIINERATSESPWAMCIGYMTAHAPYVALADHLDQYDPDEIPRPAAFDDDLRDKPNLYRRLRSHWADLDWPTVAEMIRHRYAMLSYLDSQVDALLESLDRTGQAENTIVIYTADHGDHGGAHGLFNLGVPAFDRAYHVPLLVRWPAGTRHPGRRVCEFVSLLDVAATLFAVSRADGVDRLHGRSLLPFLADEGVHEWRDHFYGEFLGHESLYTQRQVRTRHHKFVWNTFDFDELYDLEHDPNETVNLCAAPAYGSVLHDMIIKLWQCAIDTDDIVFSSYPMNGTLPYGPDRVAPGTAWGWMPGSPPPQPNPSSRRTDR